MVAWVKEEENASEKRQKKREAEEVERVIEVTLGLTVASLRRFRAEFDWTDPRTPEAASAAPIRKRKNPGNTVLLKMSRLLGQMRGSCDPGEYQMSCNWRYPKPSPTGAHPRVARVRVCY